MPQLLHFGPAPRLALIAIGRVISCRPAHGCCARSNKEALDALDKFIAGGEMPPALLQIEKLPLHRGIVRPIGAPLAVASAFVTGRNMPVQSLKHKPAGISSRLRPYISCCQ